MIAAAPRITSMSRTRLGSRVSASARMVVNRCIAADGSGLPRQGDSDGGGLRTAAGVAGDHDRQQCDVGRGDALEAAGLPERGGAETLEREAGLGAHAGDGREIEVGGDALALGLGAAADLGLLTLDEGVVEAVGVDGAENRGLRVQM